MNAPEKTNPTSVNLSASLLLSVDRWAAQRRLSRSAALAEIVERYTAVINARPELPRTSHQAVVKFLRGRKWTARDFADVGVLARRTLGARVGDLVLGMPIGVLTALVDESERP